MPDVEHLDKTIIPFSLAERNWAFLLDELNKEKVVLFIGPELLPHAEHGTVENALHHYLLQKNEEERRPFIKKFYRDDKFFLLQEGNKNQWSFMSHSRDFFEPTNESLDTARAVLRKIAEIPFSNIITLNPDTLILEAFGKDFPKHHNFFNKTKEEEKYLPGTKADPLIYFLRGIMSHDESMIISHNDLFDFLQSVYAAKSIDQAFIKDLKEATSYIFLVLSLEAWYMQLLLRIFESQDVNVDILAFKKFKENHQSQKTLYEDLYNVEFHQNNGVDFIHQFHERCQEKGLLKKIGNTLSANFDRDAQQFLSLHREGFHEECLEAFKELANKHLEDNKENRAFYNELPLAESNYRSVKRAFTRGGLEHEKYRIAQTKLLDHLMVLFNDLKDGCNE